MSIFLTILHVIVCFTLILVILLQAGRGQGLSNASFGSGNVQSLFGTRAADFMTKATTVAAICFIMTSIGLDILETRKSKSLMELSDKTAPINLDQIKEALEKVKAQAAESPKTEQAKEAVQNVVDAATSAASSEPAATIPPSNPVETAEKKS